MDTTFMDAPVEETYRIWMRSELEPKSPEDWLWCLYCERFFQAKHLRRDVLNNREGCALCPCAGFGVAIWPWDAHRDPGWPASTDELHHGMRPAPC